MPTTPLKTREPPFFLGEETGLDGARQAIEKAVKSGRVICKIAPSEFWVDICERKCDEWADYAKSRGNIVWSLSRINDILAHADVKDSFGRTWELRSPESISWLIGAELGETIIRQAAIRQELNIHGSWIHFADSSSESSVCREWFCGAGIGVADWAIPGRSVVFTVLYRGYPRPAFEGTGEVAGFGKTQ